MRRACFPGIPLVLAAIVTVLDPPGQPVNAQQLIIPGSTVNILWRAPSRQSLSIQRQLNFMGTVTADSTTETDGRSPALIALLSGPVSLERLAATLLTTYTQEGCGGIVLQRGSTGQLLISHQTSLPDGTILINRGPLGITTLNARSKPGREELIQAMEPLLK